MSNAFNMRVPEIKELFKDKKVEKNICKTFLSIFKHLGVSVEKNKQITNSIVKIAKTYTSLDDYEKDAHNILEKMGINKEISKKFSERAQIIYNQIKPYVEGELVLDLGCGDGKIGELLFKDGFKVILADVFKHQNIDNINLKFKLFKQRENILFNDDTFDTSLILTVLHHSNDPFQTIKEIHRVTKPNGRVIAIETVYGVNGVGLSKENKERAKDYLLLSEEQQRMVNIFFDYFWNRVQHYSEDKEVKLNVPFNYNTPKGWKRVFEKHGLKQEKLVPLGIDQPTAPEYHTLHILRVIK